MKSTKIFSISSNVNLIGELYHKIIFYPSAVYYLNKELKNCESVLDIGCGNNSLLRYIPDNYRSVGIEIFKNSILESKRKAIHREYILANILNLELKPKSVDVIICIEVIEHLTKNEGKSLLLKLEKIAKKKIILSTPNGFFAQDDNVNQYQMHKSGWEIKDLKELGFNNFRGVGGLKVFGSNYHSQILFMILQSIPQKLAYVFPKLANGIICTKIIETK